MSGPSLATRGRQICKGYEILSPQKKNVGNGQLFSLSEQGHVRAVLAPAQHGAQGNHQDGVQIVKPGVARPWVLQIRKDRPKSFHRSPLPSPSRLPRRRPPARLTQPKFSSAITLVMTHSGSWKRCSSGTFPNASDHKGIGDRCRWVAFIQTVRAGPCPPPPQCVGVAASRTGAMISQSSARCEGASAFHIYWPARNFQAPGSRRADTFL